MRVKNITSGPRGIWSTQGLVTLDPGQTLEIDVAAGEEEGEWFKFGEPTAKASRGGKKAAGETDDA